MYNTPRAATITATTKGTLWSLVSFRNYLVNLRVGMWTCLKSFLGSPNVQTDNCESKCMKRKQYEEFLAKVDILENLSVRNDSN